MEALLVRVQPRLQRPGAEGAQVLLVGPTSASSIMPPLPPLEGISKITTLMFEIIVFLAVKIELDEVAYNINLKTPLSRNKTLQELRIESASVSSCFFAPYLCVIQTHSLKNP